MVYLLAKKQWGVDVRAGCRCVMGESVKWKKEVFLLHDI